MNRILTISYGIVSYLIFLVAFLYAIGFVGNLVVPRSVDAGITAPLGEALIINVLLLGLFAAQHSVMARPAFKRRWTRIVPKAIERSTYVLLSSLVLILLYWQWRTMPAIVWDVTWPAGRAILWILFAVGWDHRAVGHVHDQPLRPVRSAAGLSGLAWRALHRSSIPLHAVVSPCPPSDHGRLCHRVLGGPQP